MDDLFQNERLLADLKLTEGRRQFVISGEIDDYFMMNMMSGLCTLRDALKIYLQSRGFDIIIFVDRLDRPEFLTPEMQTRFETITRGQSVDPQAQAAGRSTHTFVPRNARRGNAGTDTASSQNLAAAAPGPGNQTGNTNTQNEQVQRAQQTAVEVSNAGTGTEQGFLDLVTRLFKSKAAKSVIVFFHPEKMWIDRPTENDLRKLETILSWGAIPDGHPESASIFVVNPSRLQEFNAYADNCIKRDSFTQNITIEKPKKREIETFLTRFMCRYGYRGQIDKIAVTACALEMNLYGLAGEIAKEVRQHPDRKTLDSIFNDGDQAKTLDEIVADIDKLIGLTPLKAEVKKILEGAKYYQEQRRLGKKVEPINYHMFFLGNPGTGKTMVARLLGELFWALELRQTRNFVEISYSDITSSYNSGEVIENMRNKIREAAGGVLFIDEFYIFAEDEWGRKALETLMKEMEDNRDSLTVIMAGYEEKLPDFFKVNPGFKTRINRILQFPDYSPDEMIQMFELMAEKENQMFLSPEAKTKLNRYIVSFSKKGGIGNGRGVRNLFEKMKENRAMRSAANDEILPEDLPDPILFREQEAEKIIKNLNDNFIGLQKVKEFFSQTFNKQLVNEKRGETTDSTHHCFFVGNPGTGKTSVAREMGRLFYAMGLVSEPNKLLEVGINDFVSQYQSEYTQKVRDVFDRAIGGVLFIDEAYTLAKDEQGRKVIDQIVKIMTEPTYSNIVVIMAGYPDDMKELYEVNTGLKRRIPNEVYFEDFKPNELAQIFYQKMEKDGFAVLPSDEGVFRNRLIAKLARMSNERQFGNAGAVANYYETIKTNQGTRILKGNFESDAPEIRQFVVDDLNENGLSAKKETIDDILAELDEKFIGMKSLKQELRKLALRIRAEKMRADAAGRAASIVSPGRYNMLFVGNPGTGKTTIARYMARVFCSLGIIEKSEVMEYRGTDLKADYVGQTKTKVNEIFKKGSGSVIIIDEVYSLYNPQAGGQDSYGQEAIDTLVGCITDLKNSTTIVVLAGYKNQMETFLTANQGLASRFGTEIVFPDYSDDECVQIILKEMNNQDLIYPEDEEFRDRLRQYFSYVRSALRENFGNARTVKTVLQKINDSAAERVSRMESPTGNDWLTIKMEDIPELN